MCDCELWGKRKDIWVNDDCFTPSALEAVILDLREHPASVTSVACDIADESWPAF
jgi:hypothetical protein